MLKTLGIIIISGLVLIASTTERPTAEKHIGQYSQLNGRAIGMGTAMTAVSGDPNTLFYNPAGLADVRRFTVTQSHSIRHFPERIDDEILEEGKKRDDLDQLDADPTAIIAPLMPYGVFGAGFVLQGECGIDYRLVTDPDFPNRRVWGIERFDSYAGYITPWTKFGMYHRSRLYRGKDAPEPLPYEWSWKFEGEGGAVGVIQDVLPGLAYGYVSEKLNDDYESGLGLSTYRSRSGWSFRPLPWIHYATDREAIQFKTLWDFEREYQEEHTRNWGLELKPFPWITARWGSMNGNSTVGLTIGSGRFQLHYGEVTNFMPLIIGDDYPDKYKNYHSATYQISF